MRRLFIILFYLSLIFLFYYLIKADFLYFPVIDNYFYLLLSFALLFLGFFWQNINWKNTLQLFGISASLKASIISAGLSIFMKYIPGKILVVLGRAAYISKQYEKPLAVTTSASLFAQILTLWVGLLLGSILLVSAEISSEWRFISLLTFLALSTAILFPVLLERLLRYGFKFFKKEIRFPVFSYGMVGKITPSFFLTWLFWGFGFYFLSVSIFGALLPPLFAMAFPLAGSLAIVALFAPGGLGVREGLLVTCMLLYRIPIETATTISIASRFWFLIGETMFFGLAVFLKLRTKD